MLGGVDIAVAGLGDVHSLDDTLDDNHTEAREHIEMGVGNSGPSHDHTELAESHIDALVLSVGDGSGAEDVLLRSFKRSSACSGLVG